MRWPRGPSVIGAERRSRRRAASPRAQSAAAIGLLALRPDLAEHTACERGADAHPVLVDAELARRERGVVGQQASPGRA